MKKSLVAVAVLTAISSAAKADVTLYGVLDMGIANLTSGQNLNPSMPAGVPTQIYTSNMPGKSVTTMAPNGMSQSVLGFKGLELIDGDLSAGFMLEAGLDPNSGSLSDGISGLRTGTVNTTTGADSARAGQLFNNRSTVYIASKQYGTLSLGRQYSLSLDDIIKYDPLSASYAFSVVGFFGGYGGSGWTEDARLDNSLKYTGTFGGVRLGAMYQFGGMAGSSSANSAGQLNLGTDRGNFSVDAMMSYKHDGLGTYGSIPTQPGGTAPVTTGMTGLLSNTQAQGLFAKYKLNALTFSGGYEHILFTAPTSFGDGTPVSMANAVALGGYSYGTGNVLEPYNARSRTLNLFFGGAKYEMTSSLDLLGSFYNVHSLDYSGGSTNCPSVPNNGAISHCAGYLQSYSLVSDYHLSKQTDLYAGISIQAVTGGMASLYAASENTTTMVGFRTKF